MHFSRLAKYFSGKLPNSEKMEISQFVKNLENIDIDEPYIKEFGTKFGSVKSDYEKLFEAISKSDNGEKTIQAILEYFELPRSFLEVKDYENTTFNFPEESHRTLIDIGLLEKFLEKAKEDEFARYLMIPLLHSMGFKELSFVGKVTEKDYGIDMYPVMLETPLGDMEYLGVQFKKTNIGHGSTNTEWQTLKSELEDALSHNGKHVSHNGSQLRLDGILTITSGKKTSLKLDVDLAETFNQSFVRIYDREDIIAWCQKYYIPENLIQVITKIAGV